MLHLSANQRYFLFQGDADMRKGFDSLSGIVTNLMHRSVLIGDIFIFLNRRNNHVKLLHWEGDGFALYHKRLKRGIYERPCNANGTSLATAIKSITIWFNISPIWLRRKSLHESEGFFVFFKILNCTLLTVLRPLISRRSEHL